VTLPPNVGFELKTVVIPIASITARGTLTAEARKSRKYRQIAASIAHVGLEEPLIVSPARDGIYLLLDGAIRLDILKERNE
jgi:ParB-like chromosome segregation protein Spo0J